jgi:hypothetical protein
MILASFLMQLVVPRVPLFDSGGTSYYHAFNVHLPSTTIYSVVVRKLHIAPGNIYGEHIASVYHTLYHTQ